MIVETAVDQMLTHSGVKYVYVWRITQHYQLQQALQPQAQLTLHLQQKTQQQVLPSIWVYYFQILSFPCIPKSQMSCKQILKSKYLEVKMMSGLLGLKLVFA